MSKESELLTEKELLPCPFCGCDYGNLYFVTMDQCGYDTLGIFCNGCKQTTILEENEWEGNTTSARKRAIDAWNQRSAGELSKIVVGKSRDGMTMWYQCEMCNEPVDANDAFCRGCGRRLIYE